jgi:hypothetical protein
MRVVSVCLINKANSSQDAFLGYPRYLLYGRAPGGCAQVPHGPQLDGGTHARRDMTRANPRILYAHDARDEEQEKYTLSRAQILRCGPHVVETLLPTIFCSKPNTLSIERVKVLIIYKVTDRNGHTHVFS